MKKADLIAVLIDGKVGEQGSYGQLMRQNGAFAKLVKTQLQMHKNGENYASADDELV